MSLIILTPAARKLGIQSLLFVFTAVLISAVRESVVAMVVWVEVVMMVVGL